MECLLCEGLCLRSVWLRNETVDWEYIVEGLIDKCSGVWAFSLTPWGGVQCLLWTRLSFLLPPLAPSLPDVSPWRSFLPDAVFQSISELFPFSLLQSAPNTAVDLIDLKCSQTQFGLCSAGNTLWPHI